MAVNSAPFNLTLPKILAVFPFISISAPILLSSGMCMNLFSKTFSFIVETPFAFVIKTII